MSLATAVRQSTPNLRQDSVDGNGAGRAGSDRLGVGVGVVVGVGEGEELADEAAGVVLDEY
ncbi:MAG: hypothetical protein M3Y35_07915, partial [Actinomycetota bacterium]|nr:hypothetical protein [Actinomycetota bacterium]